MMIYPLLKKEILTEAARSRFISLLRMDKYLSPPKLKSITVLLYDISTMNICFPT